MSAAVVSRIGLPLSQVSASASLSRLSSMRSAILLRMTAPLGRAGVAPGLLGGVSGVERAPRCRSRPSARSRTTGRPVIGEMLSKYLPECGGAPFAADVVVVALLERAAESDVEVDLGHGFSPLVDAGDWRRWRKLCPRMPYQHRCSAQATATDCRSFATVLLGSSAGCGPREAVFARTGMLSAAPSLRGAVACRKTPVF